MPDEIMTAVAAALAGRTADTVFDGAKRAFTALVRLIRDRFDRDEKARKVLESAQSAPDDPVALGALTQELNRLASTDPEVAAQVSELRSLVMPGCVHNIVTGPISGGTVIQARDNYGGIHIGNS